MASQEITALSSPPTIQPTRLSINEAFSSFPAVDIVDDFGAQKDGEVDFQKDIILRMFDIMLEFKVWSESRPQAELEGYEDKLMDQLEDIHKKEEEQGRSLGFSERIRLSLVAFVASLQHALAALRNF